MGIQVLFRPAADEWTKESENEVDAIKDNKKKWSGSNLPTRILHLFLDVVKAPFEVPEEHKYDNGDDEFKPISQPKQEAIAAIENKAKYPGFEVLIRVVASSNLKQRSEALVGGVVASFSQFDSQAFNGFKYNMNKKSEQLASDYIFHNFPHSNNKCILNTVELASIFHLPSQNSIPTSGVERQQTKQVDGPAKLMTEGVLLGVNEYRGEKKEIRLGQKDRRRHTYVIGATGMGKSVFLKNVAYQDMLDGRGFAFIDPHGDAVEWLLSRVPQERMDDVILFEPGSMDNPVGMNMFEFQSEDQKDFIVQEGINMLTSLYDPGNQGIFGPRAQHMFRNAALLLMSDPEGGTFIDIPRCFIDPEFVKSKLKYVTDKTVYDYWTKEFPASQKSNDAGEVTSWFVSKWGPFLSNKMMRNILGQPKSGFNIREIMDNKKILLVNLSKGKTGELNAKLLGMIFVMKFQAAAMSRADIPEDERVDFCLFVDEFQNFATESFESILSEARKYRLNLVLANQFMTQLTDKIREAILGNVGTIICGRIGVTDAELMEKAFQPVFNAEDLHKIPNHEAVTTVLMFGLPTSPFTLKLLPPLGESSDELMARMREYALSRYGRPRAEVEAEIERRLAASDEDVTPSAPAASAPSTNAPANVAAAPAEPKPKKNFLDSWLEKKAKLEKQAREEVKASAIQKAATPQAVKPAVVNKTDASAHPEIAAIPTVAQKTVNTPKSPAIKPKKATMVGDTKADAVKIAAVDQMLANPNGSIWAAAAAQNAARAQENLAPQAPQVQSDPTMMRIHHDPKRRAVFEDGSKTATPMMNTAKKTIPAPQAQAQPVVAAQAPVQQPVMQATAPVQEMVTSIRIPHTQVPTPRPAPVAQPVAAAPAVAQPVAQTVVQPAAPTQTTASGGIRATNDGEDGVILRWR
jgi:hypothetical protein